MDITVTFWAWVKKIDLFNVKCAFSTAGADIIDLNFPELVNVRNFKVCDISNNDDQDREICVKFQATLSDQDDFGEVKRGFGKCGADIINEEFPELWDIGYFTVEKENKMKYEVHWVKAWGCAIGEPYKDEHHGTFNSLEEAQQSVRDWWKENEYKPRYVRQIKDGKGRIWWDYGLHNAFYMFVEVEK